MKPALFDIAPTELLLCAVVALVVIGPKDLPRAMRTVGQFVAKVRGVGRHFRSSFDEMVREAELKEMEEAWAKENARIMREHPPEEAHDAAFAQADAAALPAPEPVAHDLPHGSGTVTVAEGSDTASHPAPVATYPAYSTEPVTPVDADATSETPPVPVAKPHIQETERP